VKHGLVPAWLRLTLEEAGVLKRSQPKAARALAQEGLEVAEKLGLRERTRQFRELTEGLGPSG
jgi:hypothetical protein